MDRFIAKEDLVTDTRTGLMWTGNASLFEFPLSWAEALSRIQTLNRTGFNGFHDWKLPNRRELFSLMSHETINPSLPAGHPFTDVFSGYYWTATTCARLPDQAWYIHLGGARVFKGMKYASYMVWPIRIADHHGSRLLPTGQHLCYNEKGAAIDCRQSGQDGEFQSGTGNVENRFVENRHGISDTATGLIWLKNADEHQTAMDWDTAAALVSRMNRDNSHDRRNWRIPDIDELESLTDMDRHSPALPADHPFSNVRDFYWSATTSRYDKNYAWALYMEDGIVGVGHKPLPEFYLWPVCGPRPLQNRPGPGLRP